MSPFQAPPRTTLATDQLGRASCMSLLFSLNKMTIGERAEHLALHEQTCEDDPTLGFCPICFQLHALHNNVPPEEVPHEI